MLEQTSTRNFGDGLTVHTEYTDGVAIVHPNGAVDVTTRDVLDGSLAVLERDVVVDLTAVSFLDSSGTAVLVAQRQRLAHAGWSFRMVNPRTPVHRVLAIVGLDAWLDD